MIYNSYNYRYIKRTIILRWQDFHTSFGILDAVLSDGGVTGL